MKLSIQTSIKQSISALVVFLSRLRVFPANFSPLGSFGFFSQNWLLLFATIIIFDLFVGGFYKGWEFNYLGFAIYPLLGKLADKQFKRQLLLLPTASLMFFFISNFGVWWYWFPHTWSGLIACYTLALPFYQRTLIGDLVFGYGYLGLKAFTHKILKSPNLLSAKTNKLHTLE